MEHSTWQLQHAKNRFSEVVDRALAGNPQWVTRRGKSAVCVVSASDYEKLAGASRHSKKAILLSSPYPDIDLEISRDASPGREMDL